MVNGETRQGFCQIFKQYRRKIEFLKQKIYRDMITRLYSIRNLLKFEDSIKISLLIYDIYTYAYAMNWREKFEDK